MILSVQRNHLSCCRQLTYGPDFWFVVPNRSIAVARCELYLSEVYLSMYITYISVSMPSPWAVAGPNGQLVSILYYKTCKVSGGHRL